MTKRKQHRFKGGKTIDVEEYHDGRYGAPGCKREKKKNPTKEQIQKINAEDYADGIVMELASDLMAAAGKIAVESKELGIDGIMSDWKDTVIEECAEDKAFCAAVRKKGKYLKEYMAKLIQYSFENKVPVSAEILKITKVKHNGKLENFNGPLYLGIPNRMEVRKIARKYYLGE